MQQGISTKDAHRESEWARVNDCESIEYNERATDYTPAYSRAPY